MNRSTLAAIVVIGLAAISILAFKPSWSPDKKTTGGANTLSMQKDNFFSFSTEYINLPLLHVKLGEEQSWPQDSQLKIKLLDVINDGRCPANVKCEHSGWATLTVELSYNGNRQTKELYVRGGNDNVLMPPEESSNKLGSGNIALMDQYKIFLAAMNPYPLTTKKTEKSEYTAIFMVDTLQNLEFKQRLVDTAKEELKKDLADYIKYVAIGISPETTDSTAAYTISFVIPFSPDKKTVSVKVEPSANQ